MNPMKDIYTCVHCKRRLITAEADSGTVPQLIDCIFCPSLMVSQFRRKDQSLTATHEWYRPSNDELSVMNQTVKDHVSQGGLILRESKYVGVVETEGRGHHNLKRARTDRDHRS